MRRLVDIKRGRSVLIEQDVATKTTQVEECDGWTFDAEITRYERRNSNMPSTRQMLMMVSLGVAKSNEKNREHQEYGLLTKNTTLVRLIAWTAYRFVTNIAPSEEEPRYLEALPAKTWTWYGTSRSKIESVSHSTRKVLYASLEEALVEGLYTYGEDVLVGGPTEADPCAYARDVGISQRGAAKAIVDDLIRADAIGYLLDESRPGAIGLRLGALDVWVSSKLLQLSSQ